MVDGDLHSCRDGSLRVDVSFDSVHVEQRMDTINVYATVLA